MYKTSGKKTENQTPPEQRRTLQKRHKKTLFPYYPPAIRYPETERNK